MRGSFFNRSSCAVTALFNVDGDRKKNLDMIRRAAEDGADAIALQIMPLPAELRTVDCFKEMMDAAPELPFMFINYRSDCIHGSDDEARQKYLLDAIQAGAEVVDVMGDLFAAAPYELTLDPAAVQKQKDLINRIHDMGGKVIMSSHMPHFRKAEEILWHLREEDARGSDLLKIVTRADTGDELAEVMRATALLKQALSKPFTQLCNGKFSRIHRYMGPKLGCAVAFAVLDETPDSQPSIRHLKTVMETINFPPA